MSKKLLRNMCIALASAGIMSAGAHAQMNWDMANEYNDSSIHAAAQLKFAEVLSEKTDGAITITHHFGGAMGYHSQDQFDAVGDGALPVANTNITTLGGIDPAFLLSSLPFLVRSADEARALWDAARPVYARIFEENNQVLLYASPWTPAGLWSATPVNNASDFQNLKIRTWDTNGTRTLINAKASAVQLTWGDVIPQLATGGINAVLTSTEGGANAKFWEHLRYFTPLNYSMSLNVSHMNKDVYDGLTPEQQQAVMDAAEIAGNVGWEAVVTRQNDNFVEMKANGVEISDAAPVDVLDLLANAATPLIEAWLNQTGDEGNAILQKFRSVTQD